MPLFRSLFLALLIPGNLTAVEIQTDIAIYGGSAAGVIAAVQAARMEHSVILLEPGGHVGGHSVEGLGHTDIDNHSNFRNGAALGGLAADFYRRVTLHYKKDKPYYHFEPHVAEQIFADLLRKSRVPILRWHRLKEKQGVTLDPETRRITSIHLENGTTVKARLFIDATIEGDLMAFAGVSHFIGRESNAQYGETKNGILQPEQNNYSQFKVRIDPYLTPGDPSSGLIPTVQDQPYGEPGTSDRGAQAYCFRLCFTNNPANLIPFHRPEGYDRSQYEIYLRYFAAGGNAFIPRVNLPNEKTDLNGGHALSTNLYGMNWDYPGGTYAQREAILKQHLTFTQGLCWFLANDPEVPEKIRAIWSQWGVTKDEFRDNGGWPRMFYVRQARRMVSDYVITEHHTRRQNPTPVEDPVCVAYWPPDTHHVRRIVKDGAVINEGFVFGGNTWGPFGISYRSLVPKRAECVNLIVPASLSSTHTAYGAIRLEWTFMALGQAAATAASIALNQNLPVQDVPYPALRSRLLQDNQVLELR